MVVRTSMSALPHAALKKFSRNLKEILSELFKVGDEESSPAFSVSYSFKKSFFRKVVCILIKSNLPMRDYHYPVCHA